MKHSILMLSATLALTSCLGNVPGLQPTGGAGGTSVQGAAGGSTAVESDVVRCEETLGTLAVDDGREKGWYRDFRQRTGVTDVEPMIRLIAQQSNCFIITTLGSDRTSEKLDKIVNKTRDSGNFRAGSNFQKGQQVAADYFLEPSILFQASDAGGVGGAIGGLFGAAVGAALNQKHTVVNLSLYGIREGVQLAASEGSASASQLGGIFGFLGGSGGGALGGYTKTPEGKATVTAFLDAYNQMVVALKNYKAQEVEGGSGTGGKLKVN